MSTHYIMYSRQEHNKELRDDDLLQKIMPSF